MMQPELLDQLSWLPFDNNIDSSFDEVDGMEINAHMTNYDLSPPNFSLVSHFPTDFPDEFVNFPFQFDEMQLVFPSDNCAPNLEPTLSGGVVDMSGVLEGSEECSFPDEEWSPTPSLKSSDTSMYATSIHPPLILPSQDMEIDTQLGLTHLTKAYGEAVENAQTELAEAIARRIGEKVSPAGHIVERLLYHAFQPSDKQSDYLKQESSKNFDAAFKAFYGMFPYGLIAHFAANSAILEAMALVDVKTLHIIDFDMGEGVQWASIMQILGQQKKQQMTLKLTSIKWNEEDRGCFDSTKRRLYDHARSFGLKLKVEELELKDLVREIKKMGEGEWVAFNCMVGLPHMGRARSRRQAIEFLNVGTEFLAHTTNRGIVTFGDGDVWGILKNCSGFGSFFDNFMEHNQALLESMEWGFPIHLAEARIAMECLFVAPSVSSMACMHKWEEMKGNCDFQTGGLFGLEGFRVSSERLMEAMEIVNEGESLFRMTIEGESGNEMVLEWRGTPLMKISAWR